MVNTLDIIIPVYKPGENFPRLLSMIARQTFKPSRVIIINTVPGGADNKAEVEKLVRDYIKDGVSLVIRHIKEAEFDHAGTRKMAAELSCADAFLCMTDDAVPADEMLFERLLNALNKDDRIAVAYARQLPRENAGPIERYTRSFNYPDKSVIKSIKDLPKLGIKTYFASNVCCAYKKDIYEKVGGFIGEAIFNEDMIYAAAALKAGYMSYYKADACVIHSHDYDALKQLRRNFDLGMSQAMHPEVFGNIRSEGEGIKLIKGTAGYLIKSGNAIKVPELIFKSGCKYIGFKLGRAYERLPEKAVLGLSMNKNFVRRMYQCRQ